MEQFRVTDERSGESRVVDAEGSNPLVFQHYWLDERPLFGWSVGGIGSTSSIELDEPLDGIDLGIFPVSNHVILLGHCPESRAAMLPQISARKHPDTIASILGEGWLDPESEEGERLLSASWSVIESPFHPRSTTDLYVRFDEGLLRIGRHVIDPLWIDR